MLRKSVTRKWGWTAIAAVATAVMVFPLYWVLISSLEDNNEILHVPPYMFPPHPSFVAYRDVFSSQLSHLANSLLIALGATLLSLMVATPAAYSLGQFRIKGEKIYLVSFLISQMIPGISLANGLFLIFNKIGLMNTYIGVIVADCTFSIPFDLLIIRSFIQQLPRDVIEAALIDGASDWRTFLSVVVPLSRNSILTAGLFSFLFSWSDFLFAVTLLSKETMQPITVSLYDYISNYSQSWNDMMATAVMACVPAAVLLIAAQRYIVAGISGSAVKG
ncbi:MAG: carbohydrate ABC transporter permease [Alicyclobacillus sp.]|nr:carbohydrate ABC transporter permease [Alicyclobacillus sp.]